MQAYPKRLIEVDLPIKRISAHARREKSIRYGHISTLHIWWARRPLAACRAITCAALWPDPADALCPEPFRQAARRSMIQWSNEHLGKMSEGSYSQFIAIQKDPELLDDNEKLRAALLDFIADFSNWDNSTVREYYETSRVLTEAAHMALGGTPGTRPLVVDPFAGGGSIPLEALRVGADAFASDLNPVPVLLNKVVLEYIPKHGERLADEVKKWGDWVQEYAVRNLSEFYPKNHDGNTPIGYLWARTIISEAPGADEYPVEVPLLRSLWLAKASSQDRALRWVRDESGAVRTEIVEVCYADGTTRKVRRPLLEIFVPKKASEVENATVARGSATCPVTGYTTPVASVRKQLKSRFGGTADARMLAVRQTNPDTNDRTYRSPTEEDISAADAAAQKLKLNRQRHQGRLTLVPEEPTPLGGGSGAGRAFSQRNYGMDRFCDLFTPRQLLALTTFAQAIQDAAQQIRTESGSEFSSAVQSCLALAFGRLTDFCSSLCVLNATGNRGSKNTFARQALPIVWDFMETAPINLVGANWIGGIETLEATIRTQSILGTIGHVELASATKHPLPDDVASALITDPPYYDAVPYSDLSDYFYVWLKRVLPTNFGFDELLTPKDDECIVDDAKNKDNAFFEATMRRAMTEARRITKPDAIGVVVFAHKSTSGWEALLQALIDAGWTITGSWPIDTERPGRLRAMASAALASSVHLVCRPREKSSGSAQAEDIGDWRDVLRELPRRIHEWMPRLSDEGVVGADAIFACLGPALEIFSRYRRVEKANGDAVTLKEYLEQVWAAVAKEALAMIFAGADTAGFEEDARLTAMWLWTLNAGAADAVDDESSDDEDPDDETEGSTTKLKNTGFVLEYDAARKIAQGLGAHLEGMRSLVEIKGKIARLLPVAERASSLFGKNEGNIAPAKKKAPQLDLFKVLQQEDGGDSMSMEPVVEQHGTTVLDRIHQSMILFAAGRGEALKRFLVEEGVGRDVRFWSLAQALSALYPNSTSEKRWIDGVLARKKGLGF